MTLNFRLIVTVLTVIETIIASPHGFPPTIPDCPPHLQCPGVKTGCCEEVQFCSQDGGRCLFEPEFECFPEGPSELCPAGTICKGGKCVPPLQCFEQILCPNAPGGCCPFNTDCAVTHCVPRQPPVQPPPVNRCPPGEQKCGEFCCFIAFICRSNTCVPKPGLP